MFSMNNNPTYIAQAVAWGASDYLLKGSSRDKHYHYDQGLCGGRIAQPDRRVEEGRRIDEGQKGRRRRAVDPRETQVLRNLALGLSNTEIGKSLEISVETVKEHVQNVLRKLAVSDRTQVAVWAVRKGIV